MQSKQFIQILLVKLYMSSNNLFKPNGEIKQTNNQSQQRIKNLQIPANIQKFLNCLQKNCFNLNSHQKEKRIHQQSLAKVDDHVEHISFCSKFKKLSNSQKEYYLQRITNAVNQILLNQKLEMDVEDKQSDFNCYLKNTICYIPHWEYIILKWHWKRKRLTIIYNKRSIDIYIRQFLIRRSKVHPYCFVMENINFVWEGKQNNFHIRFEEKNSQQFNELENQIKKMVIISHAQSLFGQIQNKQTNENFQKINKHANNIMAFLTDENINALIQISKRQIYLSNKQFSQIKIKELSDNNPNKQVVLKFKTIKQTQQIKIDVDQTNPLIYRAKIEVTPKNIRLGNFLSYYMDNHKMIYQVRIIEQSQRTSDNTTNTFMAIIHKIIWKDKIYSQFCITKQQMSKNKSLISSLQNQIFSFCLQNIDDKQNISFIQNAHITVTQINQGTWKININACFCKTSHFQEKNIIQYLQNFIKVFQKRNQIESGQYQKNLNDQISFHLDFRQNKMHGQFDKILNNCQKQKNGKMYLVYKNAGVKQAKNNQKRGEKQLKDKQKYEYLKHFYRLKPTRQKIGVIMKEHFLWKNWKRAENGGLVCKNQQLVQRQKDMYKAVLKKFGQTLLTGKNIINFSLPVIVFKKQSHLQSLAKSYLFSPLYVEKAATLTDPLERMKYSIIIMMTENALSINMQKPFNPILGETFQGWIDGCPIYLQQISHHPPISAYYFIGRGYKKYGCIEPRISIGLNTGSGYSIFPHYVQFDDGMKIQYICAKIAIGGLLIGERTFNFEDQIYAYDRRHRYFASLSFGPVEKGLFKSSGEPDDYFHGHIYQVTSSFEEYFDSKQMKLHPEKKHIVKKIAFFDGIWNSSVNVNGQEVINFKTDLPYQFVDQSYPLPSDSIYRQDLRLLRKDDVEAAQKAKEDMQQMQRFDRKLRTNYGI